MPSVCFYFQVHQPFRIRSYSLFDVGNCHRYFDDESNAEIMQKVARKCYLPANEKLVELIEKHGQKFRVSFSISGVAIEQMQRYAPEVLRSFRRLARTGCVEFLAETYYHSLAALFDEDEFRAQVEKHRRLIRHHFGQDPQVFRNTELIYNDEIGRMAQRMGFKAIIAEGADDVLGWRSPNFLYSHPDSDLKLLLKNYSLSDDIAFRFSNQGWADYPLTAEKFASWVHEHNDNGELVNLFMDYETFGEHQWESTGIFNFLDALPDKIFQDPNWNFQTPSDVLKTYSAKGSISFSRTVSWADEERDTSAWLGNNMQRDAIERLYSMKDLLKQKNNSCLMEIWRKLQTSDHFYYMCTKSMNDGDVHAYFSPFATPYDIYIYFMNVLDDVEASLLSARKKQSQTERYVHV